MKEFEERLQSLTLAQHDVTLYFLRREDDKFTDAIKRRDDERAALVADVTALAEAGRHAALELRGDGDWGQVPDLLLRLDAAIARIKGGKEC